eukprot:m.280932 g.280932  ORF g.280932 m.280932 type:complete len:88 (-) comp111671_c0_seq1:23-286(-)
MDKRPGHSNITERDVHAPTNHTRADLQNKNVLVWCSELSGHQGVKVFLKFPSANLGFCPNGEKTVNKQQGHVEEKPLEVIWTRVVHK